LTKTREQLLGKLEPADLKAYYTRAFAENKLGSTTDPAAYKWLEEKGLPDERDSPELAKELAGYELPPFSTWVRSVREARRVLGEQKHRPRAGRPTGASIVRTREVEHQRGDDE
jgi:hypothetical protein